jgi:hypothetical protein
MAVETLHEQQNRGRRLLAAGAFEIAVLDDRDGRIVRTSHVICG